MRNQDVLWAKSSPDGTGYPLLAHAVDAAGVAQAVLDVLPPGELDRMARRCSVSVEALRNQLSFWIGLHDLGKATPGFAAQWQPGKQALEAEGLRFPRGGAPSRHDLATAGLLLSELAPSLKLDQRTVMPLARCLGAHHGRVPSLRAIQRGYRPDDGRWRAARTALLAAYRRLLDCPQPQAPHLDLPAFAWLAGLTTFCDWLASDAQTFREGGEAYEDPARLARAQQQARERLTALGWQTETALQGMDADLDALVTRMVGEPVSARPLQAQGIALLEQASAPPLMLVEAPMGEGKTELAFAAYLKLRARWGHRGAYIALPTQATGRSMFHRTRAFLEAFVAPAETVDLQLAQSGGAAPQLRAVDENATETVRSAAWFARPKRALLSPHGVGTIDQALLGVLGVRHHFLRLFGLAHKVVVLDEVHAYDLYTYGLLETLVRWLRELGASVILMSATLPPARRRRLLAIWNGATDETASPFYPRVTVADGEQVRGKTLPARSQDPVSLEAVAASPEAIAEAALARTQEGGCLGVIANTVGRAQRIYQHLRQERAADELLLFHARFPAADRSAREQQTLATLGKGGERPRRLILVATQVVEQSLDIDLDGLISDLAPVDLLLQRLGRMHRHERERPAGFATPRLAVAGLAAEALPPVTSTAWGYVYDPDVLYRSWLALRHRHEIQLPEDLDPLVAAVYDSELDDFDLAGLDDDALATLKEAERKGQEAREELERRARRAAIDPSSPLERAWGVELAEEDDPSSEASRVLAATRLGPPSAEVVLVHVRGEGYAPTPEGAPRSWDERPDAATAQQLLDRQLRLSQPAIVRALPEPPPGWQRHAALAHLHPVVLESGEAGIGGWTLRLDAELGLTMERRA
ncbi:MAG: CRISPR-associated helicase Cas3' [Halorhodospira sp.]